MVLGMVSQLCCLDTRPHLGSRKDEGVQARLLDFVRSSHMRTRTAILSGLAGHRDPLRFAPCPLLPLQALDFIES